MKTRLERIFARRANGDRPTGPDSVLVQHTSDTPKAVSWLLDSATVSNVRPRIRLSLELFCKKCFVEQRPNVILVQVPVDEHDLQTSTASEFGDPGHFQDSQTEQRVLGLQMELDKPVFPVPNIFFEILGSTRAGSHLAVVLMGELMKHPETMS